MKKEEEEEGQPQLCVCKIIILTNARIKWFFPLLDALLVALIIQYVLTYS